MKMSDDPFGTIESAHDFMVLLADAVSEAKQELQVDVDREAATPDLSRHLDALRIALYNLEKLELHLGRSSRILNDLRTLRRLLFEERTTSGRPEPVSRVRNEAAA
jgi:hypothetical protein